MTQAMVWKEWREQRALLLIGICVAVGVPLFVGALGSSPGDAGYSEVVEDVAPRLSATLIWPIFAALFGATAFGAERGGGTMDFLVSRPISRARLWGIKVGMAAACQAVIMATSGVLFGVLTRGADRPFLALAFTEWEFAPLACLVLFSAALVASTWTSRPLAAAATAAVIATATVALATVLPGAVITYRDAAAEGYGRLADAVFWDGAGVVALQMGIAAAGFLLFSLWRFAGPGLRRGSRAGRLTVASIIVAVGLLSAAAPAAIAQWVLDPAWADVMDVAVDPEGSTVVLTVVSPSRRQSQIWSAPTFGAVSQRLSGRRRAAFEPFFSPDGEWVAYFNGSAPHVWGSFEAFDLWMARPDGSVATKLAEALPRLGTTGPPLEATFAGDGRSVAVLRGRALSLVSVVHARARTIDLRSHLEPEFGPRLIGASRDGNEVFVVGRSGDDGIAWHHVIAVDFDTGASRRVARFRQPRSSRWLGTVALATGDHLVLRNSRALTILDPATGTLTEVTKHSCAEGMSREDLYYVTCETGGDGVALPTLHRWDASGGAGVRLAEFSESPAERLVLDGTGERIAAASGTLGDYTVVVFDREGAVLSSVPSTLAPRHWTPDGKLVTTVRWASYQRFRILDPTTGESYEPHFD